MAIDRRTARFGLLATVSLVLLGLIGARLWFLQGVERAKYQLAIDSYRQRTEVIPAERGRIFDIKGRVLADNRRERVLTVDWVTILKKDNRHVLFTRLTKVPGLNVTETQLQLRYDPCYKAPTVPVCTDTNGYSHLVPMPLIEGISEDQVNYILERKEDFPGIDFTMQSSRVYHYSPLASHIVGYMGAIDETTVDHYKSLGYRPDERVGTFGIEASMESVLHGTSGKRVVEIDAMGNVKREISYTAPIAGNDIELTIDLQVQQFVDQALETQLKMRRNLPYYPPGSSKRGAPYNPIDKKTGQRVYTYIGSDGKRHAYPAYKQYKAPAGAVVVENYTNGSILAMSSYPRFDNRWMNGTIPLAKFRQIFPQNTDPDESSLVNRAAQGRYNMGSSFKPFVAWSAMDAGLITGSTTYGDSGTYTLRTISKKRCAETGAKCQFTNAKNRLGNPSRYGYVGVQTALAVSSDVFFYWLGDSFYAADPQHELFKTEIEKFGFGHDTGIELPYEWDGRVPDSKVKAELVRLKVLAKGEAKSLQPGDSVLMAIGQGLMAATPVQAANAYATLANGGTRYQVTLIRAIFAPGVPDKGPAVADLSKGKVVSNKAKGTVVEKLAMPAEIRNPIVRGLRRVITGPGVYAYNDYHATTGEKLFASFPKRIGLHGKTGTAQGAASLPWNDSSAFGSFVANKEHPYAMYAYLEKAGFGSQAAAPVTKCVYSAIFGLIRMDSVQISDPLDVTSNVAAAPASLNPAVRGCLTGGSDTQRD